MNISRRELILLVIAVYMFIGYLAYQYLYRPAEEELMTLSNQKSILQEQTAQARKLEQRARDNESKKNEMAQSISQLFQLQEKLPGDKEHLQVIEFLGNLAQEKGLRLQSLSYKDKASVKGDQASSISFNLSIEGPYHKLLAYLDELESLPRIFTIDSIVLSMVKKDNEEQAEQVKIEYYYNLNPPPAAPEPNGSRVSSPSGGSSYQTVPERGKQSASSQYDINNLQMTLQIRTYYAPLSPGLEKI